MSDRPIINDAVMGLKRRIPTLAPCGIELVTDINAIRLLRLGPNWTIIIFIAWWAGMLFGPVALVSHFDPSIGTAAWTTASVFYLLFMSIAVYHMVEAAKLRRQPLLVIRYNAAEIEVPTCDRIIHPNWVRGVHYRVTRPELVNFGATLGWVRISLLIDTTVGEQYELVIAMMQKVLFRGDRGARVVAERLAQELRVPVYHDE